MKPKLISLIILITLTMIACGGTPMVEQGPDTPQNPPPQEEPEPQPEPESFVRGEFTHRDDNCASEVSIQRFSVIVTDEGVVALTVIEASPGSGLMQGDLFFGSLNEEGTVATFNALLCVATYVNVNGGEKVFEDNLQIDVEFQDIVAICQDNSPDGNCSLSYALVN